MHGRMVMGTEVADRLWSMQIKIKGAQYGEWGIQRYGRESKKVRHRAVIVAKHCDVLACSAALHARKAFPLQA